MKDNLMHFEILIEDKSGKEALNILVPKIIGNVHTFRIKAYNGIGRIPQGLSSKQDARHRALLNQLPRLLRGYGKTYPKNSKDFSCAVFLVCDLDNKSLRTFNAELLSILYQCNPQPETRFCIAIEEGEAWLLGDIPAIKMAYPKAKSVVLKRYRNDSICGTWELLAEAISTEIVVKSEWALKIAPHMNVFNNLSPSFCYFRDKMLELASTEL
jgi:hypothetical protein